MTYTVKNGTWCKDNEKEYYSTTETGLKAALKAGEITPGTRVVVHKPKYHAGQLIQSLNPECPEGCFVPHGQSFDAGIYEDLAKVFTDGKLPDLRECVLVCAGENETLDIKAHDVFNAGEFKDDQAQLVEHSHTPGDLKLTGSFGTNFGHFTPDGCFEGESSPSCSCGATGESGPVSRVTFNSSKGGWLGNTGTTGNNNVTRTKQYGVYYYIAF